MQCSKTTTISNGLSQYEPLGMGVNLFFFSHFSFGRNIERNPRKASFPEVHETDELCFVAKVGQFR